MRFVMADVRLAAWVAAGLYRTATVIYGGGGGGVLIGHQPHPLRTNIVADEEFCAG